MSRLKLLQGVELGLELTDCISTWTWTPTWSDRLAIGRSPYRSVMNRIGEGRLGSCQSSPEVR
eukprot:2020954-Prymnesium_polylepis.1